MTRMSEGKEKETLFVKSKIKEYLKAHDCNTASELVDGDALNNIIKAVLDRAIARAQGNGRKTVQGKDL